MPLTTNFHDIWDLPSWPPSAAVAPNASQAGSALAYDLRNNEDRHPEVFQLINATVLNSYQVKNDGWLPFASPALGGTFGAGAGAIFQPQRGPRGTIATGSTTTSLNLTIVNPNVGVGLIGAVAANQWASRGDSGQGFKIRIIGNGTASSGKVQEAYVTANTAAAVNATAITVTLSTALTWTPVVGDSFELLSGIVYCLSSGTMAAGTWKALDVATGAFYPNLSITNLAATLTTDSSFVCMDELYVPADKNPGQGYFGNLTATAISATTITGQATGGDASVAANEFRNFQIRIVQDTTNVTAVGQRRKITSHTAGTSAVYTVPTWTVTPSASAVFVIENANEILLWTSALTTTYTYRFDAVGAASANTWDTTTYAARGVAMGAGCVSVLPFGIDSTLYYINGGTGVDTAKNFRYSQILSFRGGNVNTLDVFDIAAGATGVWTSGTQYWPASASVLFNSGSCGAYDGATNNGKFVYINYIGSNAMYRFNIYSRTITPWAQIRYTAGAAVAGEHMAMTLFIDPSGTPKTSVALFRRQSNVEAFRSFIQR